MATKKTKYTVDYFIKKFSAIPAKKWCTGYFKLGNGHCALGHCGSVEYGSRAYQHTDEGNALIGLTSRIGDNQYACITTINDGLDPNFPQKTPRGRVLAALRQVKKQQVSK
jgi:hypothetical protein